MWGFYLLASCDFAFFGRGILFGGDVRVVLMFIRSEVHGTYFCVTSCLYVLDANVRFMYSMHVLLLRGLGVQLQKVRFGYWRETEFPERLYVLRHGTSPYHCLCRVSWMMW